MFKRLQSTNSDTVQIILNGRKLSVPAGISVAAAVLSENPEFTRTTPVTGAKRAPFCLMGVCYDCLMVINGHSNQRACTVIVEHDMHIDFQYGVGPKLEDSNHA